MTFSRLLSIRRGMALLVPLAFIAAGSAGCGSLQKETIARDRLERARAAYSKAKADRNVEAYAPVPYVEAGKALQEAEQAEGWERIGHLAYLAEQKARIATAVAERRMAERETEALSRETAEVLLLKREGEVKAARLDAEKARQLALQRASEADKARLEAEARAKEVEMARRESEEQARQAESKAREADRARTAAQAEAARAAKAQADAEKARSDAERARTEAERARVAAQAEAARAARAKAEAEQLAREVSELKAQQTERGVVLTMGDVLFATDKATLSMEANRSVEKLASFLEKYENRNVLIEGFTDTVGPDEYNLVLSQKRADSVREQLISRGVSPTRIATIGYGKKYPVAGNDTPAGRQQNRRVEVIVLNEGVKPDTQFRQ